MVDVGLTPTKDGGPRNMVRRTLMRVIESLPLS